MASRAGIRLTYGRSPLLAVSASSSRPPPVLCLRRSKPKPYRRHLPVPLWRPLAPRSSPGPSSSSYSTGFSSPVASMSSSSYEKELAAAKKAASLAARLCQISVCTTENPADASFFESYEAAHSLHDLSGAIAKVLPKPKSLIFLKIVTILPSCIFAEAGGIATDAAGNNLDFSKGRYLDLDTGIIVTNKKLMPSLLNAVQEAIREQTQSSASHL
ncbi:hypothetical protein BHM03_00037275 [Ensete ventricosum]|nr:hypothetical protein BHM03_00037275 [Ensete ventricosum]